MASADEPVTATGWPSEFDALLPVLRERWGLKHDIYVTRILGGGRSGAMVLACDVASESYTGHAILKLDLMRNISAYDDTEGELHQRAVEDAPEFAARHLPRLIHSYFGVDHVAVLSTIASGGLQYVDPWIDCAFDTQLAVVRQLSSDLLESWNADYSLSNGLHDGPDLLKGWLGYRLDPAEGGRLHAFLAEEVGLDPDAPSFVFEGREFPNPLAFATRAAAVTEASRMRAIRGHIHGDLHGLNVLVGRPAASGEDYHLIDLALYQSSQYLFYDHAYFEIATLLNTREHVSAATWDTILAHLRRGNDDPDGERAGLRSDDFGLLELIKGMRSGVTRWVDAHEVNRRPSMENQLLLARIAAGLNFAHKHLPQRSSRVMAFVYAASQLKDYVRLNRLAWPRHGARAELAFDQAAPVPLATDAAPEATIAAIRAPAAAPAAPAAATIPPATPSPQETPQQARGDILTLVGELRRRNVVKVAGVYIVVAWLSMQVVTVFAGALKLPDWTGTLVAILLGVGFVFCCIGTWAFELTPKGLQRTAPAGRDVRRPHRADYLIDLIAAVGILAIGAIGVYDFVVSDRSKAGAAAADGVISLAVLPFSAVGADADSSFVDGLTLELSDTLEETGHFRMPGVTSTFVYKDKPENVRAIGHDLGVQYVVEGNVRRTGDALRIAARLVNTSDGFTVWSGNFEESMQQLYEAQRGIAVAIGKALNLPLAIEADSPTGKISQADPFAYRLYMEAMPLLLRRGEDLLSARDMLKKSVEIAPGFADAWAALSLVYDLIPTYVQEIDDRAVVQPVYYRQAQEAALRAQKLDPNSSLVLHALGNVNRRHRQWLEAHDMYEKALEVDPDDAPTLYDYAVFMLIVGKVDTAIDLMARAVREDPLNRLYLVAQAVLDKLRNRTPEVVEPLVKLFHEGTTFRAFILRTLIGAAYETGDFAPLKKLMADCTDCSDELRAHVSRLIDASRSMTRQEAIDTYNDDLLMGYTLVDRVWGPDTVLDIFNLLATEDYPKSQFLMVPWSVVGDIGSDPRFLKTLEDMGVVSYWNERGPSIYCPPVGEGDDTSYRCGALVQTPPQAEQNPG